jgi:hypothetical protein
MQLILLAVILRFTHCKDYINSKTNNAILRAEMAKPMFIALAKAKKYVQERW